MEISAFFLFSVLLLVHCFMVSSAVTVRTNLPTSPQTNQLFLLSKTMLMTPTKPWQAIGLPPPLFATGLGSLAVPNTLESLPWIFLTWVFREPLLHMWETWHSSLVYPSETTIFMVLFQMSWLLCVGWKLSALEWTTFRDCYHHGLGSYLNFKCCMLLCE